MHLFLIALLSWTTSFGAVASDLDTARTLADQIADAVRGYLDQSSRLSQRRQTGELSVEDFMTELRRLSAEYAAGVERRSPHALLESAPAGAPIQYLSGCLKEKGEFAALISANYASVGLGIAAGCAYYSKVAADPDGWYGHLAASAGIGTVTSFAAMGGLVIGSFTAYHGLVKLHRARLHRRGLVDELQLREALSDRLGERGLRPIFGELKADEFGGDLASRTPLIKRLISRIDEGSLPDEDPQWHLIRLVAEQKRFDEFPIVDILLLGPEPVLAEHCQSALMHRHAHADDAGRSVRNAKAKAEFLATPQKDPP